MVCYKIESLEAYRKLKEKRGFAGLWEDSYVQGYISLYGRMDIIESDTEDRLVSNLSIRLDKRLSNLIAKVDKAFGEDFYDNVERSLMNHENPIESLRKEILPVFAKLSMKWNETQIFTVNKFKMFPVYRSYKIINTTKESLKVK